jgi:hypothetical protein
MSDLAYKEMLSGGHVSDQRRANATKIVASSDSRAASASQTQTNLLAPRVLPAAKRTITAPGSSSRIKRPRVEPQRFDREIIKNAVRSVGPVFSDEGCARKTGK